MEKIRIGKLLLSIIIYIFGWAIIAFLFFLLLALLAQIPIINSILEAWIHYDDVDLGYLATFVSLITTYIISSKINENSQRTHLLATFIFGIIFLLLHIGSLILNIYLHKAIFLNIMGIVFGIGFIVHGKKFITDY